MTDYTKFNPDDPPPPLMTGEPNSFAYYTMTNRIPAIVKQVLEDYKETYPPLIVGSLEALHTELVKDRPLLPPKPNLPQSADWQAAWAQWQGRTWLDVPWYFAESFFYRRVLEAVHYFGSHPSLKHWSGVDPFRPRKQAELKGKTAWQVLDAALTQSQAGEADSLRGLLHFGVWGNRIDLSYTQISEETGRGIAIEAEQENLLVDDSAAVVDHLSETSARIDIICDNAGTELLTDLALTDFLLQQKIAAEVVLHVKAHPTFVSDSTAADIDMTLKAIAARKKPLLKKLATRMDQFGREGRLQIRPDAFWNSPHFFWELPTILKQELSQAHLLIFKGDANYRRLVGDHRWPTTVSLAEAVPYLPAPFVALRTLKSDPIVGLPDGLAAELDAQDDRWRVNGKRGVIQGSLA